MDLINLSRLGINQINLLVCMASNGHVLRMVHDYRRDNTKSYHLEDDEGADTYENYPVNFIEKLIERNLFTVEEFNPCLGMDIFTLRLKKEVKDYFLTPENK